VNKQDTTAVLLHDAGQDGELQRNSPVPSQPANTLVAQSGYEALTGPPPSGGTQAGASGTGVAKPGAERKRSTRLSDDKRFKIFSGSANRPLAEEVCKFVGVPLGETRLQRFSDGETHFQLLENVRGADVFL